MSDYNGRQLNEEECHKLASNIIFFLCANYKKTNMSRYTNDVAYMIELCQKKLNFPKSAQEK